MSPLETLVDLFGSDPADLHGTIVYDGAGLAQIVLDTLAKAGFQIVQARHHLRALDAAAVGKRCSQVA
jgi:hypothetical protein